MPYLKIQGQTPLIGDVKISGAKNSALPLMIASMLTDKPVILNNFPLLTDTQKLIAILENLGGETQIVKNSARDTGSPHQLSITMNHLTSCHANHEAINQMRASFLIFGPLLARMGQASITLPGGDAIGKRPVNLHLEGLHAMGADIQESRDSISATLPKQGLHGAVIRFPQISVGATEHLMMNAALAKGETILENAALEPEITDLALLLQSMGVPISGIGTERLQIQGSAGELLQGTRHQIIPDRIEAASFMIAAIATGGDMKLTHTDPKIMQSLIDILREGGAKITLSDSAIHISGTPQDFLPQHIRTSPYPGFATDVQAQMMALLCLVQGRSQIDELIFENRFMHATEYQRMGAKIDIAGTCATIHGGQPLYGSDIAASDIRACLGLVIAALAAQGETILREIHHLDRGYEAFEEKLSGLGAKITRIHDDEP